MENMQTDSADADHYNEIEAEFEATMQLDPAIIKHEENTQIIFPDADITLKSLCRLCLHRSRIMFNIFYKNDNNYDNIINKIHDCLPIMVKKTDNNLPKHVCQTCLEKLNSFHEFYKSVKQTDEQLIIFNERFIISASNEIEKNNDHINEREEILEEFFHNGNDQPTAVSKKLITLEFQEELELQESESINDETITNSELDYNTPSSEINNKSNESANDNIITNIRRDIDIAAEKDDVVSNNSSENYDTSSYFSSSKSSSSLSESECYLPPIKRKRKTRCKNRTTVVNGKEKEEVTNRIGIKNIEESLSALYDSLSDSEYYLPPITRSHKFFYPVCNDENVINDNGKELLPTTRKKKKPLKKSETHKRIVGEPGKSDTRDYDRNKRDPIIFKCTLCKRCTFESNNELKKHEKICHKPAAAAVALEKLSCDYCGKKYTYKSYLIAHILMIHTNPVASCSHSREIGKNRWIESRKNRYNYHRVLINTDKSSRGSMYKCCLCDKTFTGPRIRDEHIAAIHMDERSFACDVCDKSFKYYNSLRKHKRDKHDK